MTECAYIDCEKPGEWRETIRNAETGETADVLLCLEHRDLVWEYDRNNRREMDLPDGDYIPEASR